METSVGNVLREARNRRKVDLSEVEAATRIRLRYLRAIENEEWDVLPGGVYTRGFIRTYGAYLGLDGERLAEDYRRNVEGPAPELSAAKAAPSAPPSGPRRKLPGAGWLAVAAVILVAVLVIVALPGGGDGGGGSVVPSPGKGAKKAKQSSAARRQAARSGVSVRLAASAEVWVCVLDASGSHLVDGQILEAGAEEGPFHSGSFTVSFGNGEVSMLIDGRQTDIPPTSSPVGYSIDASGRLTELDEAERPTCV